MIYFAQAIDGGPVKIGYTDNLSTRLKSLESHYRRPLAILATMEGGRDEEAEIHARFDHLRLDDAGTRGVRPEQFRPAPDLMTFIGLPLFVNQGDVELMPGAARVRSAVTNIRSMPNWKAWVEELAEHDRASSIGDLLDHALVAYAREIKFPKPAPKR